MSVRARASYNAEATFAKAKRDRGRNMMPLALASSQAAYRRKHTDRSCG
jgi:hypothetical protein